MVSEYMEHLYATKQPPSRAKHAILSVRLHFPLVAGAMQPSWELWDVWRDELEVHNRVPCLEAFMWCLSVLALAKGFAGHGRASRDYVIVGVAIPCIYYALPRMGEFCKLKGKHVRTPQDTLCVHAAAAVLCIAAPQNRRYMGRRQAALMEQSRALAWLQWLTKDLNPELLLFPGGPTKFRAIFKDLCKEAGMSSLGFTPASLTAGRATQLFMGGCEVARIRSLGRWRSLNSLDAYLQEAAAAMVLARTPPSTITKMEQLLAGSKPFRKPPSHPWHQYFDRLSQQPPWTRSQ